MQSPFTPEWIVVLADIIQHVNAYDYNDCCAAPIPPGMLTILYYNSVYYLHCLHSLYVQLHYLDNSFNRKLNNYPHSRCAVNQPPLKPNSTQTQPPRRKVHVHERADAPPVNRCNVAD